MKCPHCKGSGHLPEKEWRVRVTTVKEVIVVAAERDEAVEKASFVGVKGKVKKTAAPLKPRELKSYKCSVHSVEKGPEAILHINNGDKILCGVKTKWDCRHISLDLHRACKKCLKLAEEQDLFKERTVI